MPPLLLSDQKAKIQAQTKFWKQETPFSFVKTAKEREQRTLLFVKTTKL